MEKPVYVEETFWKGKPFILEIYDSTNFADLSPVTQVQAVCFDEENNVVLFKHIEGWYGLPGGTIEEGESFEDTLKREIDEEVSAELIRYWPVGYFKIYEKNTEQENVFYHLRYVAKVKLLDETPDPDGKSLERKSVPLSDAVEILGWGKRGEVLVDLAKKVLKANNTKQLE